MSMRYGREARKAGRAVKKAVSKISERRKTWKKKVQGTASSRAVRSPESQAIFPQPKIKGQRVPRHPAASFGSGIGRDLGKKLVKAGSAVIGSKEGRSIKKALTTGSIPLSPRRPKDLPKLERIPMSKHKEIITRIRKEMTDKRVQERVQDRKRSRRTGAR